MMWSWPFTVERAEEAQGASCSLENAPAWQKDLHIERVDPSQLMRPAVWASIISLLHPEPGWAKVMHHKVLGAGWYIVDSNQSSAFLTISGVKLSRLVHVLTPKPTYCTFAFPYIYIYMHKSIYIYIKSWNLDWHIQWIKLMKIMSIQI